MDGADAGGEGDGAREDVSGCEGGEKAVNDDSAEGVAGAHGVYKGGDGRWGLRKERAISIVPDGALCAVRDDESAEVEL